MQVFKVNMSGSPNHRRTELESPPKVDSQTKDAHQLSNAQERQDSKPLGRRRVNGDQDWRKHGERKKPSQTRQNPRPTLKPAAERRL